MQPAISNPHHLTYNVAGQELREVSGIHHMWSSKSAVTGLPSPRRQGMQLGS